MEEQIAIEEEKLNLKKNKMKDNLKKMIQKFQLEMKELDKHKPTISPLGPTKFFDVTKHIRLFPPFQENRCQLKNG